MTVRNLVEQPRALQGEFSAEITTKDTMSRESDVESRGPAGSCFALVVLCGACRVAGWTLFALAACRLASAADWTDQRRWSDFQVMANFSLDGHQPLLDELQRLDDELSQLVPRPEVARPIYLILFHDETTYRRYMQAHFAGVPHRRAMFIQGSAPGWVFAYLNAQYATDLRHETTHALLHSRLRRVPLWLDEGLAEYFEVAAASRSHASPYLAATRRSSWLWQVPSLADLEQLDDTQLMTKPDYRAAWSWIHFLLHGPPAARVVLREYLADLRHIPDPTTLHERLQRVLPDFERQYLSHFRGWSTR